VCYIALMVHSVGYYRCKTNVFLRFLRFLFLSRFLRFYVSFIFPTFLYFKKKLKLFVLSKAIIELYLACRASFYSNFLKLNTFGLHIFTFSTSVQCLCSFCWWCFLSNVYKRAVLFCSQFYAFKKTFFCFAPNVFTSTLYTYHWRNPSSVASFPELQLNLWVFWVAMASAWENRGLTSHTTH